MTDLFPGSHQQEHRFSALNADCPGLSLAQFFRPLAGDRLVTQFRAADEQLGHTSYLAGSEIHRRRSRPLSGLCRAQSANRRRRPQKRHRLGRGRRRAAGRTKGMRLES
jgi:hypothetical protein